MTYVQAWVYVEDKVAAGRTPREMEVYYRTEARFEYQDVGSIEIDDDATVSLVREGEE